MKLWSKIKIFILALCFIFCIVQNTIGQKQPSFESYQIKDGLPSKTIYNLAFSKNNLLYLAHSKGLSSYDGGYFRNYYNAYQPNTELSNIMEAPNGTIYAKAFNNTIYQLKNDTLQFAFWANNKSGFTNSCMIGDDVIAIGTDSVIFFSSVTQSKKAIPFPKPIETWPSKIIVQGFWNYSEKDNLSLILIDENKNVYNYKTNSETELPHLHFSHHEVFGTRTKILSELTWINKNKKIKNAYNNDAKVNYMNIIDKEIYINTSKGIYITNHDFEIIRHYNFGQASTTAIARSLDNNYFISTLENGLIKVPSFDNIQLAKFKFNCNQFAISPKGELVLDKKVHLKETIEDKDITIQLAENENQIWFERALHQAKSFGYAFKNKPMQAIALLPLIKDFTILPDAILFGTTGGLYIYAEHKNCHWLQEFQEDSIMKYYPFKKLNIFKEYVPSVKYDEMNDRLIVNTYAGLFEITKETKKSKQLPDPINTSVKDIEFWQGQLLLASTAYGIVVWDGKKYNYNSSIYPTKGYLKYFYKTKNELWVQGDEGIYTFGKSGNRVYNSSNGIPVENVKNIFISDSVLYVNHGNSLTTLPKYNMKNYSPKTSLIIHSVKQGRQEIKTNAKLSDNQNDISISFSYISYQGINKHVAYRINGQNPIHLSTNARTIHIPNLNPDDYKIELFSVENDVINLKPLKVIQFNIAPPFYKTIWFTLLAVLLSVFITFLIARYILNNYKRNALHKEAQLMMEKELDKSMLTSIKAQMNPHFLFNALNTIQSYIYSNDKQNASVYISKFSDLTRSILNMSTKDMITLDEEINSLKLYLELEKMRFEESFNYFVNVSSDLNKEQIKIPSMLVQPYIENAIKHGLLHKKTNRELHLNFERKNESLQITIDDNGIGRKKSGELSKIKNRQHASFAMEANKKRLDILKNTYKNIDFQIIDKVSELGEPNGTRVIITLPI